MKKLFVYTALASMLLASGARASSDFFQTKKPAAISQTVDLEEKLKGMKEHDGSQLLYDTDIEKLKQLGISLEETVKVASVQKDGNSIFCGPYLIEYMQKGGTYKALLKLNNPNNDRGKLVITDVRIDDESALSALKGRISQKACDPSFVEGIKGILGKDYKPVYDSWDINFLCNRISVSQARSYAEEILTKKGYPFFNAEELMNYLAAKGTLGYARNFTRNFDLKPRDLIELKRFNVDYGKFSKFIKETGLDASIASYYFVLGIDSKAKLEFTDTEKPNALIVYGIYDPDGAMRNSVERAILETLSGSFDRKVLVAKEEGEVYEAIEKIPNIMLLGLNGHATGDGVALSASEDDQYAINSLDLEFGNYLRKLHPSASIYAIACLGGEFSKYVSKQAEQRTVFSPDGYMNSNGIRIESTVPFRIRFFENSGEVTVIYRGGEQITFPFLKAQQKVKK